jgi:thiamine biosynthesis lipoprotein
MASQPWIFDAIGTRWQIDIPDMYPKSLQEEALRVIHERIEIYDKDYSRFREDSFVTRMSREGGTYTLPSDAKPLFDLYHDLYRMTGGAFTPLIGRTLVEAGYDANYSLQPGALTAPPSWEEALSYAFPRLTLHTPTLLDVGAGGKGYLVDIIGDLLTKKGIASFCINAGGDILYRHPSQSLRVGLENPLNVQEVLGIVELERGSICGSAGNRRLWANFHHTIDPRTLSSPSHILATWVVADNALLADALSTCLFLTPASSLHEAYEFSHCMLYPDMTIDTSPDFPAEFFTS